VNLIGEHTDYNGGFALPFAIDLRTAVAIRRNGTDTFHVSSSLFDGVVAGTLAQALAGTLPTWVTYILGMAAVLDADHPGEGPRGADIYVVSDVPLGSGLSSSAALECSAGLAFNDVWGLNLNRTQLAQAGQRAENQVVGTPTGIMDQSASLKGEADCAILLDCRSNETKVIPLGFAAEGLRLLIVDTKEEHSHAGNGYAARRASCEKGAARLGVPLLRDVSLDQLPEAERILDEETFRRVRHVVTEDARVLDAVALLQAGEPRKIGPLLTASHNSLRDDFEVTTPRLDLVVASALAHGALGARMTGGGFGGCAIVLCEAGAAQETAEAIRAEFSERGYGVPAIFPAVASEGARREL
jgi:galactokinase